MTERWKVGELARRTGLSVRALHHYDAIGLVVPSQRTPAGHRLYGRADVVRLQQVQSLRLMGFPLEEVKRLLDGGAALSPRQVIDLHIERLREQVALQSRLAERLTALAMHLDLAEETSMDDLCRIIEVMTTMEKHFTTEQLDVLRQRGADLGEARIREVSEEWAEIIPKVRAAMDRGVDPSDPEMLALGHRWKSLVNEFTGGEEGMARSVMNVYKEEGPALREQMANVPSPEMFAYMGKVFAAMGR